MKRTWLQGCLMGLMILIGLTSASYGQVQLRGGGYVIRMEPEGQDAEDYAKASWGGGAYLIVVPPATAHFLAGVFGIGIANMLSQTVEFRDPTTLLRVEQQTRQNFIRLYAGGRLGHQGHGFFRPYAGLNIALHYYYISTDVVVPDDRNYENEIRQNLRSNGESAFGFDTSLGVELNFNDRFFLDLGGRFVKSFSVPQQLGKDSETIHPRYIEMYLGFNYRFL